jgi:hypothetical protein
MTLVRSDCSGYGEAGQGALKVRDDQLIEWEQQKRQGCVLPRSVGIRFARTAKKIDLDRDSAHSPPIGSTNPTPGLHAYSARPPGSSLCDFLIGHFRRFPQDSVWAIWTALHPGCFMFLTMIFQPFPPCRVGATINLHEQVRKAHWSTTKGLQVRMERTPAEGAEDYRDAVLQIHRGCILQLLCSVSGNMLQRIGWMDHSL